MPRSNYLAELDELPPVVCWVIARSGRMAPLTTADLMTATGWSKNKVARFCGLPSWASASVADADTFMRACGITRASRRRHKAYWKRTRFVSARGLAHFAKHPKSAQIRATRGLMMLSGAFGK